MAMGRRGVMLLDLHLDLLLKGRERWHWGMSRWETRIKVLVCYSRLVKGIVLGQRTYWSCGIAILGIDEACCHKQHRRQPHHDDASKASSKARGSVREFTEA